jgi:CBS-domain-containing membrane protein
VTRRLFDPKLKGRLGCYLWQCGLAMLIVLGILALLDIVLHAAIIATLGASSFIVFACPARAPLNSSLAGGYLIGASMGMACSMLTSALAVVIAPNTAMVLCAALAVG